MQFMHNTTNDTDSLSPHLLCRVIYFSWFRSCRGAQSICRSACYIYVQV